MRSTRAFWLVVVALSAGCDRGASEATAPAARPPASAPTVPAATPAAQIDRASIVAFVHRWAQLQTAGDLLAHAALYAPGFAGSERVAELTTPFDLTGWLEHRRRSLGPSARVLVPALEILRGEGVVAVVIEPRDGTAAASEGETTTLLLERAGESWRILREDLIRDEPGKRARGPCATLLGQLAGADAPLQHFANLAGARATEPRWAAVSSHDDADGRSDDGYVWELWTFLRSSAGQIASVSRASPAGDWVREASFCFRSDGTPLEVIDRHRTLLGDGQLVDDVVTTRYSRQAVERSSTSLARFLVTGKPAPADAYLRPPPLLVERASDLPFAALLRL